MAKITLPKWLLEVLPKIEEPAVLSLEDSTYFVESHLGKESFNNLIEVQDYLYDHDLDIKFHESINSDNGLISFLTKDGANYHMLMELSDVDRFALLVDEYEEFLAIANAYKKDPTDIVNAYNFIDTHPAFWHIDVNEVLGESWLWNTSDHCTLLRQSVDRNRETGAQKFSLETGSTVREGNEDQAFKIHYGDWRLDSRGATYEEAIIDLARKLALTHDLEGNDIYVDEDIMPRPDWVLDLEKMNNKDSIDDFVAIDTLTLSTPDDEQIALAEQAAKAWED